MELWKSCESIKTVFHHTLVFGKEINFEYTALVVSSLRHTAFIMIAIHRLRVSVTARRSICKA